MSTEPSRNSCPVYLFTVDSLRADFFESETFPQCWDRFTSDFARFSSAYANGIATPLAFPSILADDLVTGNGVIDPAATTLAELLSVPSVAVRNNVHLSPARGYDRGFSRFGVETGFPGHVRRAMRLACYRTEIHNHLRDRLPLLANPPFPIPYIPAERMVYELKRALSTDRPRFLWGHFMDPHGPYYPELVFDRELPFSSRETDFQAIDRKWSDNEALNDDELEKTLRIYEEKIGYLDRHLAGLFDWLEAADRYDGSLIIITADHGQLVGESGRFGHDWDNVPRDELLRVPFLMKYPDGAHAGEVFSHPVQHLDIVPTVAQILSIDANLNPDGGVVTEPDGRTIIAKSNRAVRGISTEGEVRKERDGEIRTSRSPPQALIDRVRAASPASVGTDVGQESMSKEERKQVNERLSALGYQ